MTVYRDSDAGNCLICGCRTIGVWSRHSRLPFCNQNDCFVAFETLPEQDLHPALRKIRRMNDAANEDISPTAETINKSYQIYRDRF